MPIVPSEYRYISAVLDAQLAVFPEHERFLSNRFASAESQELQFLDEIADLIIRIADPSIGAFCEDYRWLTQMFAEEEIYFWRNGHYRLSKFADAVAQVYDNAPFMRRYMNGLLVTRLWWKNHSELLRVFRDIYLPGLPADFSHLEIGPGHGFFLYLAARMPNCSSAEGWDISPASVEATRLALARMGASDQIILKQSDIFAPHERKYDSLACCEVLEHLEDPAAALRGLRDMLVPGGRMFITSPVNAPAPDHIYLFRKPEELVQMMEDCGLQILHTCFAPATGATLERARKQKLTISCAVVAAPAPAQ